MNGAKRVHPPERGFDRIAVIGAGTMGPHLAATALANGISVHLVDISQSALAKAQDRMSDLITMGAMHGTLPRERTEGTLTTSTDLADLGSVSLLIEAVPERFDVKTEVLEDASRRTSPDTPTLSITSVLPATELGHAAQCSKKIMASHVMNPFVMKRTIELARGKDTSDAVFASTLAFFQRINRRFRLVKDTPGFVINRGLLPLINQAIERVQTGVATAVDVDGLYVECLGHTMGPIMTGELIGLDNVYDSLLRLHERTGDPACQPCNLLRDMVDAGLWGAKTGKGFFTYDEDGDVIDDV
jgi:methoxymalonate biosynthesis protein